MDYKYQYKPIKILEGKAARNIRVPKSIIINKSLANMRLSLFVYFSIRKGLDDEVNFVIQDYLKWAGYKKDSHKGGINEKVIETINEMCKLGYVQYLENASYKRNSTIRIKFNSQLVHEQCFEESFAIIYLDEIDSVMSYKNCNKKDRYLNRNTVLLVFAFLRQAIFRTPNKLKPEERSPEKIEERKLRCIEAYNGYYKEIGESIGVSSRNVSQSSHILQQLNLIMFVEAYHIKNEKGEYRTAYTIFANMQKREFNELLAEGRKYALDEIKRKAERINSYNPDYKIKLSEIDLI